MIQLKKYFLPIGLLCLSVAVLIEYFLSVEPGLSFFLGMLYGLSVPLNIAGIYRAGKRL